jgi:hypothetical protein
MGKRRSWQFSIPILNEENNTMQGVDSESSVFIYIEADKKENQEEASVAK